MFTVVCFDEARASAVTTLDPLAAVADDHVAVVGDDITVPDLTLVIGAYAFHGYQSEGNPTGGQISAPSLRGLYLPDISKMHGAGEIPEDAMIEMLLENPFPLVKDEKLNALMTNGAITSARGIIAVFLADAVPALVTGAIRTVKATTSFTGTADVWKSTTLSFSQDLPTGRYQVVGMRVIDAGVFGIARLIFVGPPGWRPGCPITQYIRYPDLSMFRHGRLGVWGEFDQKTPPKLEVCSAYASSNPDVYLDLIKIA